MMAIATESRLNIRRIAEDYCGITGNGSVSPRNAIRCNAEYHRRVADAFDALPVKAIGCERTISAYASLAIEVNLQFGILSQAGIRFDAFGDDEPDPYGNRSDAMIHDLTVNRHLWVYSGGADHPFLNRSENWRLRAVHDVFGHAMHGYSFGPNGEESAYRCHLSMFSEMAGMALATETRGQNSWVNFGPFSNLPRADRPFATQKSAILPIEFRIAY